MVIFYFKNFYFCNVLQNAMQYDILEAFLLFLLIEKFGDLRYEKK